MTALVRAMGRAGAVGAACLRALAGGAAGP